MAALTKTPSGTWKATIRRVGWPTAAKTFRTKRDAEDWARRTEDEMVRGVFIQRAPSEKTTVADALDRYEREIVPTKKASTQRREGARIRELKANFGKYSLAAVTPDLVSRYRDDRLARGKANNTVRLELALLGHLFNVAIKEWHIGLIFNPVANIRKPSPGEGRNRRLSESEQAKLLATVDQHSNPMLGWIVRLSDKKNSIWKPIQKSKAVIPAMNDLRNLRFYQRLWTKKPSGINNGQPVLVGSTPAHYEGTYDAGLISKDIEKRWINGEAIVPPYKPNLYGDEGIKGDPNTSGRDKPDYVSRDTLLGNPSAKDIRAVVMPDVPKDVFDGGYQKVLAWFNSQSPDPEDHTDSVWLSDGGKLTYHRLETPNEVRSRLEKRDAKSWDKNSYHSAVLRDSDNIRRVAAMDVAIGQAKSLDDPNVRNLFIAIADWKIDSKGMDAIENNPYYSSLDDSSKSLVKGNFFYYTQGKFPSSLVPTKPPKMVDAETYKDRAKNRQ